jgi:hypothetical protein
VRELVQLLNEMRSAGVIEDYALLGAVAQMRYTEPVATLDADVVVAIPEKDRLDVLSDEFCAAKGFRAEGEAIRVGSWPTQVVPVFSAGEWGAVRGIRGEVPPDEILPPGIDGSSFIGRRNRS